MSSSLNQTYGRITNFQRHLPRNLALLWALDYLRMTLRMPLSCCSPTSSIGTSLIAKLACGIGRACMHQRLLQEAELFNSIC